MAGRVSALSTWTCGSQWGAWLSIRSFSRLSRPRRSVVSTYIEDIKTILCTPSDHHLPPSVPTLWIAYSELSSPFWPSGSAVCRTGTGGSQYCAWLFVCSFSRLSCPRRLLVCTYIHDIKTDTILYAIRPPPSNLHSYSVDSIQ